MMKPRRGARLRWVAVVLLAPSAAWPAGAPPAFGACVACHGARAEGNASLGAPALAGQRAAYLERQLRSFRDGRRGTGPDDRYGAQMRAIAATLRDDAAIAALASYLAGLPPTTVRPPAKFDALKGNNLYQGKCGACHGSRAEGNDALSAPRLAGLDTAYFTRQFQHFRQGIRGADPKDRYGKQMTVMAATLPSDQDLADVIAYVQTLGAAR